MGFGRNIEGDWVAFWGARAIYEGYQSQYHVDLLADRQSGDDISDGFLFWLNNRALPWLRAEVKRLALGTDDDQVLSLTEYKYHLEACANRSFGYLYIGAVERPVTSTETWHNDAADNDERILETADHRLIWSKPYDPPEPGTPGVVKVNGLGPGVVVGYQDEPYPCPTARLLNFRVKLESPPDWWVKQTMNRSLGEWLATGGGMGSLKPSVQDKLLQITDKRRLICACENTARVAPSSIFTRGEGMRAYRAWKAAYESPPLVCWDVDFVADEVACATDGTS
jgi:hypothetical protein